MGATGMFWKIVPIVVAGAAVVIKICKVLIWLRKHRPK